MHVLVLLSRASELCVKPPTTAISVLKLFNWRSLCKFHTTHGGINTHFFSSKLAMLQRYGMKLSKNGATAIDLNRSCNFKFQKLGRETVDVALLHYQTSGKSTAPTLATLTNLTMISDLCWGVVLLSTMHCIHCDKPLNRAMERSSLGFSFRLAWMA